MRGVQEFQQCLNYQLYTTVFGNWIIYVLKNTEMLSDLIYWRYKIPTPWRLSTAASTRQPIYGSCFWFITKTGIQQIWHTFSSQRDPHRYPEPFANVSSAAQCSGGKNQVSWALRTQSMPATSLYHLRTISHESAFPGNGKGGNLLAQGPRSKVGDTVPLS